MIAHDNTARSIFGQARRLEALYLKHVAECTLSQVRWLIKELPRNANLLQRFHLVRRALSGPAIYWSCILTLIMMITSLTVIYVSWIVKIFNSFINSGSLSSRFFTIRILSLLLRYFFAIIWFEVSCSTSRGSTRATTQRIPTSRRSTGQGCRYNSRMMRHPTISHLTCLLFCLWPALFVGLFTPMITLEILLRRC